MGRPLPSLFGAEAREYSLPRGVHVNVQEGDRVRAGEPLMDGPRNPHDILAVLGEMKVTQAGVTVSAPRGYTPPRTK